MPHDKSADHQIEGSPRAANVDAPLDNIQVENECNFSMFEDEMIAFGSEIQHNLSMFVNKMIGLSSKIDDIKTAAEFIKELKHAKLDDSNMLTSDIACLHEALKDFPFDVYNPDFLLSLQTFLAVNNASQHVYNSFCDTYLI